MSSTGSEEFRLYILSKYPSKLAPGATNGSQKPHSADGPLRILWESTALSADDFANEVASFWQLPRLSLPELLSASAVTGEFSRRFLRENSAFPLRT